MFVVVFLWLLLLWCVVVVVVVVAAVVVIAVIICVRCRFGVAAVGAVVGYCQCLMRATDFTISKQHRK